MKYKSQINNRFKMLWIMVFILLVILVFRLAILTMAEGKKYRELADNKRVREIEITAPRGEIRDRNGVLLAGNKPVFTLQLSKDEISRQKPEDINEGLVQLLRLLERDGVNYLDELPIVLNVIRYKEMSDYKKYNHDSLDEVADRLINNDLVAEFLMTSFVDTDKPMTFQFLTINRAINALHVRGIDVPITATWNSNGLSVAFNSALDSINWKKSLGLNPDLPPLDSLVSLMGKDKTLVKKVLNHSLARALAYNILVKAGLDIDLSLEPFSNANEESFRDKKASNMRKYRNITLDSSAKSDFLNIFHQTVLSSFLEGPLPLDENGNVRDIPKEFIDSIERAGVTNIVEYQISADTLLAEYSYIEGKAIDNKSPLDWLVEQGSNIKAMELLSENDGMKALMQTALINKGIYTDISIAKDFAYVQKENDIEFRQRYKLKEGNTAEQDLKDLLERYKINDEYNIFEKRGLINLYYTVNRQGFNSYIPLNFAYGLKDVTVASITEQLTKIKGINISVEPIRYYPYGKMAAHILGYLGKISQPDEMEKFLADNRYSIGDMIGKTGVEESYEDLLKGEKGYRKVVVDSMENTTDVLYENLPVAGNTLFLTIDADLQRATENALVKALENIKAGGSYTSKWGDYQFNNHKDGRPYYHANSGAAIMVDVKTGEILALASYPSFDPNLFATGITSVDWESLLPEHENDPLAPRPLYNIATQTAVQPGSIFKMITGLTALEKGLSPEEYITDMGFVRFRDTQFNCLAWTNSHATHGNVNIYTALKDSCNYYFYSLMLGENQRLAQKLPVKVEIEDLIEMAKKFGLNEPTGIEINIPKETAGGIPEPAKKLKRTQEHMRQSLNERLVNYYQDEVGEDAIRIEEIIDEIVSWTEMEEPLSRNEVTDRLKALGINGERRPEGLRMNMTDYIKYSYLNHAAWHMGDSLNASIGQGQNEYSLAQMASYIATIANGGYLHKFSVVHDMRTHDNQPIKMQTVKSSERIGLKNYENLEHIKMGMLEVSRGGTSSKVFSDFPIKVGSKTGTAEREGLNPGSGMEYDDFTWTVAFAPYDDPEIAVATILVQGGSGGHGAPILRDMIAAYMGLDEEAKDDVLPIEEKRSE
ncbi:MAG: hypothetical protein GXZ11_01180 [Tissierellia bacterium]|nr:hypothetical protein [Tissierellia bacterium]